MSLDERSYESWCQVTTRVSIGVRWEAKNEWNRLAFSLKYDITLSLWKIGEILGIYLLLKNLLRIDQ